VVNAVLVAVFICLLFGNPWVGGLTGVLFGLHPLTVEPVPWLGERKTLLAAFFALASLSLYLLYVQWRSRVLYATSLATFVLSLLAKPTTTPLPILLLLLDGWPLNRLSWRSLAEKGPFLVVAAVSAAVTFVSQSRAAIAVVMPQDYSPYQAPLTVCHNIVFYLRKMVWPTGLTPYYPFPEPMDLSQPAVLAGVVGTGLLIAGLLLSLRWTRALLVGWLFFFVGIAPTLNVIAFTRVIASDKYVYLPGLGMLMLIAWGMVRLWKAGGARWAKVGRPGLIGLVLLLAVLEADATRAQLHIWQDTESLYRHMLTYAPQVDTLHDFLGQQLYRRGCVAEALEHYTQALRLNPKNPSPHNNIGVVLAEQGKFAEARQYFAEAVRLKPDYANGFSNLGRALAGLGQLEQARQSYEHALELDPNCYDAHQGLGILLATQGDLKQAEIHFRRAIALKPDYLEAHIGLGRILWARGRTEQARQSFEEALRIRPEDPRARADLERLRAASRPPG